MRQKTLAIAAFAFLCAIGLNAAVASAQVANLVGNPSLETPNGNLPAGWTSSVYGTTKATFTYPSSGGHTGTRFVTTQLTTPGTGDAKWLPASIVVTPGTSYTFSDWYQSTAATQINLEYTLSAGTKSNKVIGSPTASATWKQFQATFVVPANVASVKIFHLISATGTLSVDDYSLTSNAAVTPFDFSIGSEGNKSVMQGQTQTNAVTATLSAGTTAPVTFSVSGLPAGVTASFSAASCSPTCSSTLTLVASASATVGSSAVTITGTSGSVVKTSTFTLTVTSAPVPPVLAEVTPVATLTNDNTPDYIFNSTKAGTITYGGDCTSSQTAAIAGNNTVTFAALSEGSHSSCTISVKDSTGSVSNTLAVQSFTVDSVAPSVTINQDSAQLDPATTSPIFFTAVFNEPVSDFDAADVNITGTASPATVAVSGSGTTYSVAVSGMQSAGTLIADIPAGGAHDAAGNGNTIATSNDSSVAYSPFVALPPPPAMTLAPSTLSSGTTTLAYSQSLLASTSAAGPFTWSLTSGVLPAGLTLGNSNTLANSISGTPTATGTASFTIKVSNGISSTTQDYSITIAQMPVTPPPANLVSNGDFETASGSLPLNWKSSSWGTRTVSFVYPATGKSGKGAQIKVTSYTSGDSKWLYPHVTIAPNTIYLYNEDYSANVGTSINIEYKMADGSLSYKWLSSPTATSGWGSASFTITPPAGAVSFTVFHLISAVGTLTIDNVSLIGVVPQASSNLIQNGDLEIPNGSSPYNWAPNFLGNNTRTFTYPIAGKNGGKAMQVQITSFTDGSAKWLSGPIAVSGHTFYAYSEDYKSDVSTNITVSYKKTDGTYEYEWLGNVPPAMDWTHYATHLSVPSDTVSLTIQHALVSAGTLAVDNVDLEAQSNDAFATGMVSITFDDGFISQYQNALPILQAAGYKAGFYIITSYPGSNRPSYMNWDQIKALAATGQEIGSHTRTHPHLTQLTASQLQDELVGSKADLTAQGLSSDTFVYPNADMSTAVENAVKDAGYTAARSGDFGLESTLADKYNISSVHPDAYSTLPVVKQDIDQAIADKRWLVLVFHDMVSSGGTSNAVTPAFFQGVVDYLTQKGITPVTLSQGASQLHQ